MSELTIPCKPEALTGNMDIMTSVINNIKTSKCLYESAVRLCYQISHRYFYDVYDLECMLNEIALILKGRKKKTARIDLHS